MWRKLEYSEKGKYLLYIYKAYIKFIKFTFPWMEIEITFNSCISQRLHTIMTASLYFLPKSSIKISCNRIFSKTSLTPSLFIEGPVPCHESKRPWMCIQGIDFASFYNLSIRFWNCSDTHCGIFVFHFISQYHYHDYQNVFLINKNAI